MYRLGHGDYDQINELVRELYRQPDATRLIDTLLDGLASLIPCENLGYNEVCARSNHLHMVIRPRQPVVYKLAPTLESHLHEHPVLQFYRNSPNRQVCQTGDFLSLRQFRQLGIYHEFYRHINTDHQIVQPLSAVGATTDIAIAIARKRREFTQRDRAMLAILQRHVAQARTNAQAHSQLEDQTRVLSDSLTQFSARVMILEESGKIAWSSPGIGQLMERYFHQGTQFTFCLPKLLERWWRQRRMQTDSSHILAELQVPFVKSSNQATLTIHVFFHPGGTSHLLLKEENHGALTGQAAQAGLTSREAEVLHWLSEGKNNPEIAIILQISPRTVHKHLEHIFRKLRVETRHAATLKALEWKQGSLSLPA